MPKQTVSESGRRPAIGYVRVDEDEPGAGPSEVAAFLKDIADCCKREGLHLMRTFVDRGYDGSQLGRPGVVDVRHALVDANGLTVVVPTLDHLSPHESIRSPFLLMIHRLGGRVVVAGEPHGEATSPTADCDGLEDHRGTS